MLTVFMILLIGLYALAVYVFKVVIVTAWVGVVLLLVNVASAILSLLVIFSLCCVRNSEKRQQVKLATISFFMAAIYLVQYGVATFIAHT
uniref:NADH dehydrogenase subunit 4L n=1 Tax=Panagrolaimus sp. ES5 TaxID=591445 RepID=A0AC34FQP8_9BILA